MDALGSWYPLLVVSVVLAFLVWRAVYNLFFHPLAKIPGPWLPALTTWYEAYFDCFYKGGGQLPFQLQKLHDVYGPIIRPAPNHVHISDPSYLDTIYAQRNRNAIVNEGMVVDRSMGGAGDFELHRIRRDAMSPFFSQKAVIGLESLMAEKNGKVARILHIAAESRHTVNLSDIFFAYSNDVVRSYSFGSDGNLLDDLQEAKRQRTNLAQLLLGVNVRRHFTTFFRILSKIMLALFGDKAIPLAMRDIIRFKQDTRQRITAVLADNDTSQKGRYSVFHELKDSSILPPEEKTIGRLEDEAMLLVMAGTESPTKSLGIAAFYLLHQPEVMNKLRSEIADARRRQGRTLSLVDLLALPYLNAVLTEANRLSYGVTNRMSRYSPNETLRYTASSGPHQGKTYALPPKTPLSTVTYCTHTDETLYPQPHRFDPSRWIVDPENPGNDEAAVNRRKRCMVALGKGHRRCLGISLANASMSLLIAELAGYDMVLVDTDERDVKFQYDFQISHPRLDSKGVQVKVEAIHSF